MTMLDKILGGEKLWNIHAPIGAQINKMREVRADIAKEHQEHLDDDEASHINTGVLLGALNLIDGLLRRRAMPKAVVKRMTQALALLNGATVVLAEPEVQDGEAWIGLSLQLKDGEEVSFVVSRDDEGNGPGALLGFWEFARKHGI